jgi:KUP system potassium uptake protein
VIAVNGFFFIDRRDLLRGESCEKLFEGGWFPLLLAGAVAFLMLTWRGGVKLVEKSPRQAAPAGRGPDRDRGQSSCRARLPGTAVFLASASPTGCRWR